MQQCFCLDALISLTSPALCFFRNGKKGKGMDIGSEGGWFFYSTYLLLIVTKSLQMPQISGTNIHVLALMSEALRF